MPKCDVCSEPVKNGFRSNGKKYCSEKCLMTTWGKCELCGKRVQNGYHIGNKDGAFFCKDCMEKPKCFLCGHPDNCKELSDGRFICSNCDKIAINTPAESRVIFDEVRIKMKEKLDMITDHDIKFKLVNLQELNTESELKYSDESMEQGLFVHEERTKTYIKTKSIFGFEFGRETKTEVINNYSILMLFSLTKDKFIEVAAHELAHDWMQSNYPNITDLKISEGWAEFVATQANNQYGNSHMNSRMRNNPDPVYGEGYRYVAGYAKEHGVAGLYKLFSKLNSGQ
ncbi:MAG: protein DA1 [Candidatus Delongbacteria bacterium]|nr:protein DA1 [Candidatus Delongbacteria bacterium]